MSHLHTKMWKQHKEWELSSLFIDIDKDTDIEGLFSVEYCEQ